MLLTRLPLMAPEGASSLDLHALSAPLAFILSHDQTLRLIFSNSSELPVCVRCSLLFPVTIQLLRSPLPTVKPMPCAPALRIGLGNFQVSPPAVLPALFCLERLLVYHTRALPSRALLASPSLVRALHLRCSPCGTLPPQLDRGFYHFPSPCQGRPGPFPPAPGPPLQRSRIIPPLPAPVNPDFRTIDTAPPLRLTRMKRSR